MKRWLTTTGVMAVALLMWVGLMAVPAAGAVPPDSAIAPSADNLAKVTAELQAATAKVADVEKAVADNKVAADTMWTLIAGMLVFFMNLGFAMVESGLCRAKNTVNILAKNFIVFACASLAFLALGWGLMFGSGNNFFGTEGLFFAGNGQDNSPATSPLSSLIKEDLAAEPWNIDLGDETVAEKFPALVSQVEAASETARTTITSNTTVAEGKEEEVAVMFKVALDLPEGKGKFEKDYEASSFYWGAYPSISWAGIPFWAKFFFQLVFAGTAATIVSGAVAERIKFGSFILFSFLLCGITYPIVGHLVWGGGYLGSGGMFDFAGSTVVHSVGGWAALAGVLVLGPRLGKYNADGSSNAIPGHSMTSVTLGGLILWFGWFGFNPGSTMAADASSIGHIAVTTNTAAAAATLAAAVTAWLLIGKPDLSMIINGTLAGLVAVTAPCAFVSVSSALIIGVVAGVLVVLAVLAFDKLRLDDPVGALSVHLVNGIWGTLAVGLFAQEGIGGIGAAVAKDGLLFGGGMTQLTPQILGVLVAGGVAFGLSMAFWLGLKYAMGIRVSDHEQIEGLDLGEHDQAAYPDFQITTIKSYHLREM